MSFWKKEHNKEGGIPVHYCEKHNYRTSNPDEIEEHERIHAIEEQGMRFSE